MGCYATPETLEFYLPEELFFLSRNHKTATKSIKRYFWSKCFRVDCLRDITQHTHTQHPPTPHPTPTHHPHHHTHTHTHPHTHICFPPLSLPPPPSLSRS